MAWIEDIVAEAAGRLGLGGAAAPFVHEVVNLITGGPGGLGGFIGKLQASGFGGLLSSWLAGDVTRIVPPQGVEQLFGSAILNGVAQRSGIARENTERWIGEILPRIVPGLAPGGVVSETAIAEARETVQRLTAPGAAVIADPVALPAQHDVVSDYPAVAPAVARAAEPVRAPAPRPQPVMATPAPVRRETTRRSFIGTVEQNPFKYSLPLAGLLGLLWMVLSPHEKVVVEPARNLPAAGRIAPPSVANAMTPSLPVQAPAAASVPSRLWINRDGERVIATGTVRDAATRSGLLDALRNAFGADRTRADIVVDPNAATAPWLANIGGVLDKLKTGGFSALFEGNSISLGGLRSDAERDGLVASLKGLVGDGVSFGNLGDRVNDLVAGSTRHATSALAGLASGYTARDVAAALSHGIINFDTNSAVLPAGAATLLDAAAGKLKTLSGAVIEVAGYTDNTGDAAANLKLSQERADSVRARLLAAGVPAGMISAKGYGSADPVASNETAIGRFRNRRIEYRVVGG